MVPILVAFLSLATTGIFHTILGTALPAIQVFLGMDTAQTGLFASFAWLGFTAAIFAGGILSDIFEQNLILMLACITVGLSSILFGFSSLVGLNCLLISLLGAGTGVISSSSSALVMKFYPRKEGLMINIHHFFYGIGAITGPLSMGYVLEQGWHWQWVYRAGGLWMLLLAGILAFQKKEPQIHKKPKIDKSFFSLIREKNLLLLVLITLLGCGTYNGVSLWLVSFLKEIRSFPIFQASLGLSLFSTGLAIGRLLSGWVSSKIGNTKVLLLLLSCLEPGPLTLSAHHGQRRNSWNLLHGRPGLLGTLSCRPCPGRDKFPSPIRHNHRNPGHFRRHWKHVRTLADVRRFSMEFFERRVPHRSFYSTHCIGPGQPALQEA